MVAQSFPAPYGASDAYSYLASNGTKVIPSPDGRSDTFVRSFQRSDPGRSADNTAPTLRTPSLNGARAIRRGPRAVTASRRDSITYRVRPFDSFDRTVQSIASMVPADREAAILAVAEYWARECESMLTRSERIHYAERLTAEHSHLGALPKSQRIRAWLTGQLVPIVRSQGRTSSRVPTGWDLRVSATATEDRVPAAELQAQAAAAHRAAVSESPEAVAYRLHLNGADHSEAHCALCH